MGRLEKHLDPEAGPLAHLAYDLRALRCKAGSPTYREMSLVAGYSPSALSAAASGASLPSAGVLAAYVGACEGDVDEWRQRRIEVALALRTAGDADRRLHHSNEGQEPIPDTAVPPECESGLVRNHESGRRRGPRRRFSRHIAGLAAAAVLGSMATIVPMAIWGAPSCLTSDHGRPPAAVSCPPRTTEAR